MPVSKDYILYDYNYMKFWKRQNYSGNSKKLIVVGGWGER
jgi:hypothetical protein